MLHLHGYLEKTKQRASFTQSQVLGLAMGLYNSHPPLYFL